MSEAKKETESDVELEVVEEAGEAPPEKKEDDVQEKYIRLAADFDNFRKRVHKEKADYVRYANENLVRDLLPILDNFERALEHVDSSKESSSVAEGVKLIFSQIQSTLLRFGVRSESAQGKVFDPLVHEAVSHIFSKEHPAQAVIQEHQKAYFLHDRLIRPALVTVSKGSDVGPDTPTEENKTDV